MCSASSVPLFTFHHTPISGLGVRSVCPIPSGTTVLTLPGPSASVIMRKWRKEVCAWCFVWRYAVKPSTSSCEPSASLHLLSKLPLGLWFCSPSCLTSWRRDYELWEDEGAEWVVSVLVGAEKTIANAIRQDKDRKEKQLCVPEGDLEKERGTVWEYLRKEEEDGKPLVEKEDIIPNRLDRIWKEIENALSLESRALGDNRRVKGAAEAETTTAESPRRLEGLPRQRGKGSKLPKLNELELDTARFVLDGMVRKIVEQFRTSSMDGTSVYKQKDPSNTSTSRRLPLLLSPTLTSPGCWEDFLLLQNNEVEYIRSKPYTLASWLKIYVFLTGMVRELVRQGGRGTLRRMDGVLQEERSDEDKRACTMEMLHSDLQTSDVVRAILGRDPGNVFGIWEEGEEGESEMFGWGAYVFGSFFNHDCSPNLNKRRLGRLIEFYALRDVCEGEEMCIAYVNVEGEEGVWKNRNNRLEEEWFFGCQCSRCSKERSS